MEQVVAARQQIAARPVCPACGLELHPEDVALDRRCQACQARYHPWCLLHLQGACADPACSRAAISARLIPGGL